MRVFRLTARILGFACLGFTSSLYAQLPKTVVLDSSMAGHRLIIPGAEYRRSGWHQFLWGKQYRKEWTTPVNVAVLNIDTIFGGLKPLEQGGGRQTKTLRLEDRNGRQYVLRTIDKDYAGALPEIVQGTWIERQANDEVSTAHPFAAVTIPPMIEAAGVYHTTPQILYVPYTPSLGKYNETFSGMIALLERRPDENQEDNPNFGYSKDVKGTDKMLANIWKDNSERVDQAAFVRARLFDMFVGDWGRHEDQWRWATFDSGEYKIYKPIPRDRDQVYTRFDGFFMKRIVSQEALEHLHTFDDKIKNVKKYNFPARYIDRQLLNGLSQDVWIATAQDLQTRLTDTVISRSIRQMPPELYPISGPKMISDLEHRRDDLQKYAEKYYKVLAREVDVVGSKKSEQIVLDYIDNDHLRVAMYDLDKNDQPKATPFYDRTFLNDETRELRIYGLEGHDRYVIRGEGAHKIRVRLVGGIEEDKVTNTSRSSAKLKYYDNPGTSIEGPLHTKISSDTSINRYEYMAYKPNSGSVIKSIWYSNTRGFYLKGGYQYTKQQWRKQPFGWTQKLQGVYSITNNSWGGDYFGQFNEVIGKLNLVISARYDQKLSHYYFGRGNNTSFTNSKDYYNYFLEEGYGTLGFNRIFGHHTLGVDGVFQRASVAEKSPLMDKLGAFDPMLDHRNYLTNQKYAGAQIYYHYRNLNDNAVPTKGFAFTADAMRMVNLDQSALKYNRYDGILGFYLPLVGKLSLASRFGAATVTGDPEFYQLPFLGGGSTLRGYQRERFTGQTALYNNNDLRFIFPFKSRIMNGKMGLIGFIDEGQIRDDLNFNDDWHIGYGGGFMIAPFNKASLTVYYGTSKETQRFHLSVGTWF